MTAASIELSLLKCLRCGRLVPAQEDEVAWVCAQCGQGLQLAPEGLAPLGVNWAAGPARASGLRWAPFWVFAAAVAFARRESYEGSRPPEQLWNSPVRFYVPAYSAELHHLQALGADLTRRQPKLTPGPAQGALAGCTLSLDDAYQAADFIVLTIEAAQSDKLRSVEFSLKPQQPELWLLPFAGEPQMQNLALSG